MTKTATTHGRTAATTYSAMEKLLAFMAMKWMGIPRAFCTTIPMNCGMHTTKGVGCRNRWGACHVKRHRAELDFWRRVMRCVGLEYVGARVSQELALVERVNDQADYDHLDLFYRLEDASGWNDQYAHAIYRALASIEYEISRCDACKRGYQHRQYGESVYVGRPAWRWHEPTSVVREWNIVPHSSERQWNRWDDLYEEDNRKAREVRWQAEDEIEGIAEVPVYFGEVWRLDDDDVEDKMTRSRATGCPLSLEERRMTRGTPDGDRQRGAMSRAKARRKARMRRERERLAA